MNRVQPFIYPNTWPLNCTVSPQGAAIIQNGERIWATFDMADVDSDIFPELGTSIRGNESRHRSRRQVRTSPLQNCSDETT